MEGLEFMQWNVWRPKEFGVQLWVPHFKVEKIQTLVFSVG